MSGENDLILTSEYSKTLRILAGLGFCKSVRQDCHHEVLCKFPFKNLSHSKFDDSRVSFTNYRPKMLYLVDHFRLICSSLKEAG